MQRYMLRRIFPFAILLGAMTLMPPTPTFAQTPATSAATKVLPLVPNRFIEAGLAFWLTLQGVDGGFSENAGKGAQESPPISFV